MTTISSAGIATSLVTSVVSTQPAATPVDSVFADTLEGLHPSSLSLASNPSLRPTTGAVVSLFPFHNSGCGSMWHEHNDVGQVIVGESNHCQSTTSADGYVRKDFGSDVSAEGPFGPAGDNFSSSVPLTSDGQPVTVTVQPSITSDIEVINPKTGKATPATPGPSSFVGTTPNGTVVFTLTINSNGSYNFTLNAPLSGPKGSGSSNEIGLNFGVTADSNGGTNTGTIRVNVVNDSNRS
jgi:hypothetical protein